MRKTLLVFFVILISSSLTAQSGLHLAPKMMTGAAFIFRQKSCDVISLIPDPGLQGATLNYDFKLSYFGGVSGAYFFRRNMGIEMDILYSNGGQNYTEVFCKTYCAARYEVIKTVTISQLQIPIMFKWVYGQDGWIKGYLAGGPNFGILLSGKEVANIKYVDNITQEVISDTTANIENVKEKFKGLDLGFNMEAGAHLYFKKNFYLNIGMNTCISMIDINSALLANCISKNDNGVYRASRNFRFGAVISINYVFFNKERRIRWRNGSF